MIYDIIKCPECGSENISQGDCYNVDCCMCGMFFSCCLDCSWDEHPYCITEEEWDELHKDDKDYM